MLPLLKQILAMIKDLFLIQQPNQDLLAKIEAQQVQILAKLDEIIKLLTEPDVVGVEVKIDPETTH
jgi:hypothetical protein